MISLEDVRAHRSEARADEFRGLGPGLDAEIHAGREAAAPAWQAEVRPLATEARGPSAPAAETAPAEEAAEAAASDSTEEFIVVQNFDASAEKQFQEGQAYRFGQGQLETSTESGAEGESGESDEPRDTGAEASA